MPLKTEEVKKPGETDKKPDEVRKPGSPKPHSD
jgi:hypothetical protein